jgi:hypothetical protein
MVKRGFSPATRWARLFVFDGLTLRLILNNAGLKRGIRSPFGSGKLVGRLHNLSNFQKNFLPY